MDTQKLTRKQMETTDLFLDCNEPGFMQDDPDVSSFNLDPS